MEKKEYIYKLVDDYNEEDSFNDWDSGVSFLHTDKDAKKILEVIIEDIWANRYNLEDIERKYKCDEENNTFVYNEKEYEIPENYGELMGLIYEVLDDNDIKHWYLVEDPDETFYY